MLLVKYKSCRKLSWYVNSSITDSCNKSGKRARLRLSYRVTMCCSNPSSIPSAGNPQPKVVWILTESKQVMTAAVERGWNTFIFPSDRRELANEWSCKWVVVCFSYSHALVLVLCLCGRVNGKKVRPQVVG